MQAVVEPGNRLIAADAHLSVDHLKAIDAGQPKAAVFAWRFELDLEILLDRKAIERFLACAEEPQAGRVTGDCVVLRTKLDGVPHQSNFFDWPKASRAARTRRE